MGAKSDEAAARPMPAGMQHFAWSTGESIIQIDSDGPFKIKYVNPADDRRTSKR
jgi:hypothetical protein